MRKEGEKGWWNGAEEYIDSFVSGTLIERVQALHREYNRDGVSETQKRINQVKRTLLEEVIHALSVADTTQPLAGR